MTGTGIVRAAAYIANINDACVGTDPAGSRYCGRMIPTMEKPLFSPELSPANSRNWCHPEGRA
jgi:hypothetical protein